MLFLPTFICKPPTGRMLFSLFFLHYQIIALINNFLQVTDFFFFWLKVHKDLRIGEGIIIVC